MYCEVQDINSHSFFFFQQLQKNNNNNKLLDAWEWNNYYQPKYSFSNAVENNGKGTESSQKCVWAGSVSFKMISFVYASHKAKFFCFFL